MEAQLRSLINVRDELEEVRGIIIFMGTAVGAAELQEVDRAAAKRLLEQQAGRLLDCSASLGTVVSQAGNAPS